MTQKASFTKKREMVEEPQGEPQGECIMPRLVMQNLYINQKNVRNIVSLFSSIDLFCSKQKLESKKWGSIPDIIKLSFKSPNITIRQ